MGNEVEIVVTGTNRTGNAFKSVRKDVDSLGNDIKRTMSKAGKDSTESFTDAFGPGALKAFNALPPQLKIALAAGATLALPAIGAAVSAGVALGVGGGALAAGIALAAQDPAVSRSWSGLFSDAGTQLKSEASSFTGPLIESANIMRDSFSRVIPTIGDAFDSLAPRIGKLAAGAGKLFENMFNRGGFDRVIKLAGEMFDQLAAELPNIGNAMDSFFDSIASGGNGAKQFWSDFLVGTQRTIVGLGEVVEALSKTYEFLGGSKSIGARINDSFDKASVKVSDFAKFLDENIGQKLNKQFDEAWNIDRPVDKAKAKLEEVGQTAIIVGEDFGALTAQINTNAESWDTTFGAAVDKVINGVMGMDQAALSFEESQGRLNEAVKKNGTELDIQTHAGQNNREAVLSVVTANMQLFDMMLKTGFSADQATDAYNQNTQALENQMRNLHFTQEQIDQLIGKYRNVPNDVKTDIETNGLTEAINGLNDLIRRLNGLDGRVARMTVEEVHRTTYVNGTSPAPSQFFHGLAHGGISGAAGGGPRGNWTWVGEQGPELVKLAPGSTVIPSGQSKRMGARGMAGGGLVGSAQELLNTINSGGRYFEDMSFTGSSNDNQYSEQLANTLYSRYLPRGYDFGGPNTSNEVASALQRFISDQQPQEMSPAPGLGGKLETALLEFLIKSIKANRYGLRSLLAGLR